jgi:hypothetical protein
VGINFAPGPLFYFFRSATLSGIALPVGIVFGIPTSSQLSVALSFDLPMFVVLPSSSFDGQLILPVLFGGGFEFYLEHNLALTFSLKMGPMIFTRDGVSDFDLQALMGLAIKL